VEIKIIYSFIPAQTSVDGVREIITGQFRLALFVGEVMVGIVGADVSTKICNGLWVNNSNSFQNTAKIVFIAFVLLSDRFVCRV